MYKRRKNNKNTIIISWVALLTAVLCMLSFIYIKIRPIIIRYAESVAETTMLNSANKAVINILKGQNIEYDDIAHLTTNAEGLVTSLEIDTKNINLLKAEISGEIAEIIAKQERYTLSIPLGTFLSNVYTSGLGPDVNFKMQITTTAVVDFSHEFKSAGINQVLHLINIEIKIYGSLIVAGYRDSIFVSTTAIAAQTVITGAVPDAFTSVIESEEDNTGGLINDYGATIG